MKMRKYPLEMAEQITSLFKDGLSKEIIAKKVGCHINHVKKTLRIPKPSEEEYIQELIRRINETGYTLNNECLGRKSSVNLTCPSKRHTFDIIVQSFLNNKICEACNREARKGLPKPNHSKYTWGSARGICKELNLTLKDPRQGLDHEKVFHSGLNNWEVTCHCGRDFTTRLSDILERKVKSCGCVFSEPENEIRKFIEGLGFKTKKSRSALEHGLEIDIYLPDLKIGFEHNGLYHHSEKVLDISRPSVNWNGKTYHKLKHDIATKKDIKLIQIFANEWYSRQAQVKGYILACLKKTQRIGARKCSVREISDKEANKFHEENHIQGVPKGPKKLKNYGIFHYEKLIAVATFVSQNKEVVLARYTNKIGIGVQGGLSKILKYCDFNEVVTFSDNRWSNGTLYKACKFVEISKIVPNYFYFYEGKGKKPQLINKAVFRKEKIEKMGYNIEGKTENELTEAMGLKRIWDAGKIKWKWSRP